MKTIKDYHEFIMIIKCDVLLLADAFQKFRKNSSKNYGLCQSHYLNPPGLSWDSMLKMTKIKLVPDPELIPDPDMYTSFEKCIRGGISYIFNRNSKAKNKYLKFYDPKQDSKHIVYLDANDLYDYV